jgi:hypothetical protein
MIQKTFLPTMAKNMAFCARRLLNREIRGFHLVFIDIEQFNACRLRLALDYAFEYGE